MPKTNNVEEMVPTLKGATVLHLLRLRKRMRAVEIADALGCSPRTAYRVLQRLELSREFSIWYERPYWHYGEPERTN